MARGHEGPVPATGDGGVAAPAGRLRLVLGGDVMIGRGVDQALADPLPPRLHEPWVHDARDYLRLAEAAHGPLPLPVDPAWPWGDALAAMDAFAPHARLVNLETALTTADTPWPGKGIHYRARPSRTACLRAARIDACALANNHVLDWGRDGLRETLAALRQAGIATAGAGEDADAASRPAALPLPLPGGGRLLFFAWATPSSGVPDDWEAGPPGARRAGVALLRGLDAHDLRRVREAVARHRRDARDRVVVSLHWGANWVHEVPEAHRRFGHALLEDGTADVVHGHSSHHPLRAELHAGRLLLPGCGDLVNDYEGIAADPLRAGLRDDIACLHLATLSADDGRLATLRVVPFLRRRLRLGAPDADASRWVDRHLAREVDGPPAP